MPKLRGGELVAQGEPLGALYRYFPAEYMEGQRNVADVITATRTGAVRSLTSFAHIYAQSKLAFARAWAHEGSLDDALRASLGAYIPRTVSATSVSRSELEEGREDWVLKRAYGRVGDQVYVGPLFDDGAWRGVVDFVLTEIDRGESWIAQRFVRQRAIPTPWGPRYVTLGAYVEGGHFAGYFARVTAESHVSHDALCVPVFREVA